MTGIFWGIMPPMHTRQHSVLAHWRWKQSSTANTHNSSMDNSVPAFSAFTPRSTFKAQVAVIVTEPQHHLTPEDQDLMH